MTYPRRFLAAGTFTLALLWLPGSPPGAQPADETVDAMNARLASATVDHVSPSYLYPKHATTPGLVNPDVTQANIQQTICVPHWTETIRPSSSVTTRLKQQQLTAAHASDKTLAHWEEDHFISLKLGGHPRDARNLWPERWGTPGHPLTQRGPFPDHLVGAKTKDKVENALHDAVCHGTLTLRQAQLIIAWFRYYRDNVLK